MVCGVTVLTAAAGKRPEVSTCFTSILGQFSDPRSRPGRDGVQVTGNFELSVYSSTSGVVLPAFLPGVPELVRKLGKGGDPLAIASLDPRWVGHLVDVSPLSDDQVRARRRGGRGGQRIRRLLFNRVLACGVCRCQVVGRLDLSGWRSGRLARSTHLNARMSYAVGTPGRPPSTRCSPRSSGSRPRAVTSSR